ncbi:MAG: hypothetical protein ACR2MS_04985 [Weeksellaceae bacterium]
MKKILLFISFLSVLAYGQEEQDTNTNRQAKNEITVGLLDALLDYPTISYERLTSSSFGFGIKAGFDISGDDDKWVRNYNISPFGRLYFLNTGNETYYGRRFFIEASAGIVGVDGYEIYYHNSDYNNYMTKEKDQTQLGLGVGVGYKYVNRGNWIGIVNLGVTRTFGDDSDDYYTDFQIGIGKRF